MTSSRFSVIIVLGDRETVKVDLSTYPHYHEACCIHKYTVPNKRCAVVLNQHDNSVLVGGVPRDGHATKYNCVYIAKLPDVMRDTGQGWSRVPFGPFIKSGEISDYVFQEMYIKEESMPLMDIVCWYSCHNRYCFIQVNLKRS